MGVDDLAARFEAAVASLPIQARGRLLEILEKPDSERPAEIGSDGGLLRHSNFYHRRWQPALRDCAMPRVGVHVLRHSAAAAWIHSGASPKTLQQVLGHRSAAFTLTEYGHLFDPDLDSAAAALEATLAWRVGAAT